MALSWPGGPSGGAGGGGGRASLGWLSRGSCSVWHRADRPSARGGVWCVHVISCTTEARMCVIRGTREAQLGFRHGNGMGMRRRIGGLGGIRMQERGAAGAKVAAVQPKWGRHRRPGARLKAWHACVCVTLRQTLGGGGFARGQFRPRIILPGNMFATLEIPKALRRHNPRSCGELWNCFRQHSARGKFGPLS